MGNMPAAFSAHKTTNRKDWGLNSNTALETGGLLVGDQPLLPKLGVITRIRSNGNEQK
jgi:hypothetical protein